VGGELTIDNLDIQRNPATGIHEAPVQMKSNCGTLVVDDFGRQRVHPSEMLNRWIVPLEKRHDYLTLANGRKVQVPFDQLVVFSSNLDPASLVDEAFLRRIPYKIEVKDPSGSQFRALVCRTAAELGIEFQEESIDYLIERAYGAGRRPRFCHAQDLLAQVVTYCDFLEMKPRLTRPAVDSAVQNYFAIVK
jgi:predicted ATPase with chaperone activity